MLQCALRKLIGIDFVVLVGDECVAFIRVDFEPLGRLIVHRNVDAGDALIKRRQKGSVLIWLRLVSFMGCAFDSATIPLFMIKWPQHEGRVAPGSFRYCGPTGEGLFPLAQQP